MDAHGLWTNRVVIVGVSYRSSTATATATYGGTSMTLLGSRLSSTDTRMAMFSLVNPPTGLQTVTVTFSVAVSQKVGGSVSMTGADQTTPTGAFFSATGNSSTASLTVTSATGELVIDTVSYDSGCTSITPDPSQTQQWNLLVAGPDTFGGGSTKAGAASVPMSWTCPPTGDHWALGAVSVKPAGLTTFAVNCNPGPTTQVLTGMGGTLSGFTTTVDCSSSTLVEGGVNVQVYQITSTATQGTVGTLDRVERQLQATLTK